MTPKPKLKVSRGLCLFGCLGSLLVWMLPVSLKPYHIKRYLTDYKVALVEQVSEWGFDADGLVRVRYSRQFSDGPRAQIDQIRRQWHAAVEHSTQRWPTDGKRLHYDEWGPSNWQRPDGVHEIEVGSVLCVPYAFIAMVCAAPLGWWTATILFGRLRSRAGRLPI